MSDSSSWTMSSAGKPDRFPADDTMVMLTMRSRGALSYAPRTLTVWFSADETCVRTPDNSLLWLATDELTAWPDADQNIVIVPTRRSDPADTPLVRDSAAEACALRSIAAAAAWLDSSGLPLPLAAGTTLIGRTVDWFRLPHARFIDLRVAADQETGVVLAVTGTNPDHGDLAVEVTTFDIAPRRSEYFAVPASPK